MRLLLSCRGLEREPASCHYAIASVDVSFQVREVWRRAVRNCLRARVSEGCAVACVSGPACRRSSLRCEGKSWRSKRSWARACALLVLPAPLAPLALHALLVTTYRPVLLALLVRLALVLVLLKQHS